MLTAIASLLALLDTAAARSCDLAPAARPDDLARYHQLAETCLLFPPEETRFAPDLESALVERINADRAAAGLAPLAVRPELAAPARFHSLDMAWTGTFGHDGTGGSTPFERIAALDRSLVSSSARENVSRIGGDIAPGERVGWIHDGLMQSEGHRANILAEEATHVAVGVVASGDRFYTTQLFVTEVASLPAALPVALVDPGRLAPLDLPGWTFDAWTLAYPDGAAAPVSAGTDLPSGEARLMVSARRPDPDDPMRYFTIAYPGPAVVIP